MNWQSRVAYVDQTSWYRGEHCFRITIIATLLGIYKSGNGLKCHSSQRLQLAVPLTYWAIGQGSTLVPQSYTLYRVVFSCEGSTAPLAGFCSSPGSHVYQFRNHCSRASKRFRNHCLSFMDWGLLIVVLCFQWMITHWPAYRCSHITPTKLFHEPKMQEWARVVSRVACPRWL